MREGERHVNIIEPLVTLPFPLFMNVTGRQGYKGTEGQKR